MRVLTLRTRAADVPELELHPYLTVLTGLSPRGRQQLARLFASLPAGTDPGLSGLLEVHGYLLDLNAANLRLLELHAHVDPVVRAVDTPGARAVPVSSQRVAGSSAAVPPRPVAPRLSVDGQLDREIDRQLQLALVALDAADQARHDVEQQLRSVAARSSAASAASGPGPAATPPARAGDPAPTGGEPASLVLPLDVVLDLEAEAEALRADLLVLEQLDTRSVELALHEYEAGSRVGGGSVPTPSAVSERAVPVDPLRLALARARAEHAAAEARLHPAVHDPDLLAQLEVAHEAVLAAQQRVEGLVGRRRGRGQLDEAIEAEQAVLRRLGASSYAEVVLDRTAHVVDPALRREADRRRESVAELEAHVARRDSGDGRDLFASAAAELGVASPAPGTPAIAAGPGPEALATLVAIARAGGCVLDPPDDADDGGPAASVAAIRGWLDQVKTARSQAPALLSQLLRVEARLERHRRAQNHLMLVSTAAPRPPETPDHRQDGPREHDRQVREEVTDLGNELAGLEAEVEERRREVHHLEARLRAARERSGGREGEPVDAGSVAPSDVPSTAVLDDGTFMVGADAFVRDPTVHRDEIEWFLLGRLAAQRQVSFAGSLPLLLDDALHGLHQEDLELLLDRLSQTADAVQLVYLSDDPTVVEWALRLGPFVGALVEAPSPEL